jgi:hypothetical protein
MVKQQMLCKILNPKDRMRIIESISHNFIIESLSDNFIITLKTVGMCCFFMKTKVHQLHSIHKILQYTNVDKLSVTDDTSVVQSL